MTRPLGGKNMKTDALWLPFLLYTIVTSPSSPPPSSSSLALHVSTTTHHWGQAPFDNGSFHHPQDWFNLYCNRCGTTTSPKSYQPGELRSSHRKAPCFTAAKSKGTARPSWISKQVCCLPALYPFFPRGPDLVRVVWLCNHNFP